MIPFLLYRYQGKLLRRAAFGGKLARSSACCCVPPGTCCCDFDEFGGTQPTPLTLTATIHTVTGGCVGCLPATVTLTFDSIAQVWEGEAAACASQNLALTLTCDEVSCKFTLSAACGHVPDPPIEADPSVCSPLLIEFGVINFPVGACCEGTFKVTITE